jgi:hypothetical protein
MFAPVLGTRIPASMMPVIETSACALKTAAKAATATRVLILLVLIHNKSNIAIALFSK